MSNKKNVAIVAGGDSSEVVVSLKSAAGLYSFIDKDKYQLYIVTIVKQKWEVKINDNEKVDIDKNDFSFLLDNKKVKFDFAYITIHGTPGENGLLQGYFELIGLPYSCCNVLSAAITFNKFTCNQYLKGFGVKVSEAILLRKNQKISSAEVIEKVGLPCFVKPNVGGSSFGVTKVKTEDQIQTAIEKAFSEGEQVMIEAFMAGTEITCGMYKTTEKTVVFPVTEVVPQNEFFDFDAKYKGQVEEITPARISENLTKRVQQLTAAIYDILDCKGIVRVDYIISEGEVINLLEVNTTPGMTTTSFIPQQVAAAGIDIKDVMTDIIENELQIL
jgi:D-alanine-D-alanine ligase